MQDFPCFHEKIPYTFPSILGCQMSRSTKQKFRKTKGDLPDFFWFENMEVNWLAISRITMVKK